MVKRGLAIGVQHQVPYMMFSIHENVVCSLSIDNSRPWQMPVWSLKPFCCAILLSPEQLKVSRRFTVDLNLSMVGSRLQ